VGEPEDEGGGLLATIDKLIGNADEISEVVQEGAYELSEVKADGEGVIGRALYGVERIERGRNALKRLRDPERKEPPGKLELAMETWNFLFGDGTGKRDDE
jgi:hypothetical protein